MSGDHNQYQRDQENVSYMYSMPPQEHVHLSFYKPPPIVGYWVLPPHDTPYSSKFAAYCSKPNWLYRTALRLVLGIKWEDEK